jgi:hypothetical protein
MSVEGGISRDESKEPTDLAASQNIHTTTTTTTQDDVCFPFFFFRFTFSIVWFRITIVVPCALIVGLFFHSYLCL